MIPVIEAIEFHSKIGIGYVSRTESSGAADERFRDYGIQDQAVALQYLCLGDRLDLPSFGLVPHKIRPL